RRGISEIAAHHAARGGIRDDLRRPTHDLRTILAGNAPLSCTEKAAAGIEAPKTGKARAAKPSGRAGTAKPGEDAGQKARRARTDQNAPNIRDDRGSHVAESLFR